MAVLEMQRVHILAMKRDRKKILELLQRNGTVEVSACVQDDEVFSRADTAIQRNLLAKNIESVAHAMDIVSKYCPAKGNMLGFLQGRKAVSVKEYDVFYEKQAEILKCAQNVNDFEREIAEAKAEILRGEGLLEALIPWERLPIPQKCSETKKTAVFIGSVAGEVPLEQILMSISEAVPQLQGYHLEIISSQPEQTCLMGVCLKKDIMLMEEGLRALGFTRPANATSHTPAEKKKRLLARSEDLKKTIIACENGIGEEGGKIEAFKFLIDHFCLRKEKYEIIEKLAQSKHVFVLDGYVPKRDSKAIETEISKRFTQTVVEFESAMDDANAPTVLKNNWVSAPVETVLESYSMPGNKEIDPTPVMSVFYYIMFGLMFGDAGYGLILIIVCGIVLLKFRNMEETWSKMVRLFFFCGITTTFWGVVFSSYFGDVVDVVSATFFGNKVSIPPLWFIPMQLPMKMLIFSLAVGLVHLFAGLGMKAYALIKQKQWIDIIYDAVFPFGFVGSLLVILIGTPIFWNVAGTEIIIPTIITNICSVVAGVCALGILLTSGRESRNWGKRLLKGLYGLYNAFAGWLSDILSYSRLLALGLASGVIAQVVNKMGAMGGNGIVGIILFIVVFAVGHTLNFGIEALGAYVHTNRLQFVEFFGKFYEGGGHKLSPFGMHTKYYKIEEDSHNG